MINDVIVYSIYGLLTGVVLTIICLLYGFDMTMSALQFLDSLFRRPTKRWRKGAHVQEMKLKRETLEGITRQIRSVPPIQLSSECILYAYRHRPLFLPHHHHSKAVPKGRSDSVVEFSEKCGSEEQRRLLDSDVELSGGEEPTGAMSFGVANTPSRTAFENPCGSNENDLLRSPSPIPPASSAAFSLENDGPLEGTVGESILCKLVLLEGEIHVYEILSQTRGGAQGSYVFGGSGGGGGGGVGGNSGVESRHALYLGSTAEHFRGRIPLSTVQVEHYIPLMSRQRKAAATPPPVGAKGTEGNGSHTNVSGDPTTLSSSGRSASATSTIHSTENKSDAASNRGLLITSRSGGPLLINTRFGNPKAASPVGGPGMSPTHFSSLSPPTTTTTSRANPNGAPPSVGGTSDPPTLSPRSYMQGSSIPSTLHQSGSTVEGAGGEERYNGVSVLPSNRGGGGASGLLSWTALVLEFKDPRDAEMWYAAMKGSLELDAWREYLKNIPLPDTLNTFVGRLLFPSLRQKGLEKLIRKLIREKLEEVTARKFPRFLTGGIHLDDFVLGSGIPWISEVSEPAMSTHGEIGFDLNILYKGEAAGFALFFRFALAYRGFRIPRFILSVKLLELQASLHISIGPPPSKKIWVGLHRPPTLRIQANQGCASGKGFLHRILTSLPDMSDMVCNLLRLYCFSEMILPEMDDFGLPSIEETSEAAPTSVPQKPVKGTNFDRARAAEISRQTHLENPLSVERSSKRSPREKKRGIMRRKGS